jgi:hypothetical protein
VIERIKQKTTSILKMQDSFFYLIDIAKENSFNKDTLLLNFSHLSPYKNSNILPFQDDTSLLLWFYKNNNTTPIFIPEAYLLYLKLKEINQNAIFIIKDNTINKIIVIKDNRLQSVFCSSNMNSLQKFSLSQEYSINDIIEISNTKAKSILEESFKTYPIWNYQKWYISDIPIKEKAISYIDKAVIPLSIMIATFIALEYSRDLYIKDKYQALEDEYLSIKKQNDSYREALKSNKKYIEFNNNFYYDILLYPNIISVLSKVSSIVKEDDNNTIKYFKLSGATVTFQVETFKPIDILNASLNSGFFNKFKIVSTRKAGRKSKKELVSYEGKLKLLRDIDETN